MLSLPEENQLDQVNILFLDFPAEFFEFSLMRHIFLVKLKLFVLCKKKKREIMKIMMVIIIIIIIIIMIIIIKRLR